MINSYPPKSRNRQKLSSINSCHRNPCPCRHVPVLRRLRYGSGLRRGKVHGRRSIARRVHDCTSVCVPILQGAQGGGGAVRHGRTAGGQAPGRVRAALCCVRRAGVAVKATTAALPAAAAFREPQTLSTACTLASNFGPAEEPCRRTRWTTSWAGVCICLSILLPCVRSCVSDQRCCYLVGHGMLCRKG